MRPTDLDFHKNWFLRNLSIDKINVDVIDIFSLIVGQRDDDNEDTNGERSRLDGPEPRE